MRGFRLMTPQEGKSYYLAGPMTGYPQFNIPLFECVTAELRAAGYTIVSPVELDSTIVREVALASADGALENNQIAGETWGEILARDVRLVADKVDGVIVLPRWNYSRGARLEVFVALLCSKPIYSCEDGLELISRPEALSLILKGFFHVAAQPTHFPTALIDAERKP